MLVATCAASTSAQSTLCSGCWCLEQPVLMTPMPGNLCSVASMATCAVSTSAQSNLCSRCWYLEQPVLIAPMRRQPVLGRACGNPCRFDLCAEQPVLWLLVLRATCAHNTSAPATCARLRLWQPVPFRLLRRATCALAAASMATCAVSTSAQSNLCSRCRCLEQPVLITPMRRQPVRGCACGNLCRFDLCAEQPVLSLLVLRATCAHNTYAPATCARLRPWQPVPFRSLRRATCALAAGA